MNRAIFISVLSLLAACGEHPPNVASIPSPLWSADADRLWILARASKVGDGRECIELYLQPDDPRYQGRSERCDYWARDYADYLKVNGFPTIEHLHLKDPAYWQWYLNMRTQISECKSALGYLPVGLRDAEKRQAHQRQKSQCDPYDDARNNQELTPADLGIRYN